MLTHSPPVSVRWQCAASLSRTHHREQFRIRASTKDESTDSPQPLLTRRRLGFCGCCCAAALGGAALLKSPLYARFEAHVLATGMESYETALRERKTELFKQLQGVESLLEVGVGGGPNLRYYPDSVCTLAAVEPNDASFRPYLERNAAQFAPRVQLSLLRGVGEALPVADASMDAVVCTLVLCSVQDPLRVLSEVARVLKPRGRFLFVEHVAALRGESGLRLAQTLLDPLQQAIAGGCHLTRDTGALMRSQAGHDARFSRLEMESFSVPGLSVIAPHVAGIAYKA